MAYVCLALFHWQNARERSTPCLSFCGVRCGDVAPRGRLATTAHDRTEVCAVQICAQRVCYICKVKNACAWGVMTGNTGRK